MWLYYVGGAGALLLGYLGVKSISEPAKKKTPPSGPLVNAPGAPLNLPLVTAPIQPAGVPQPRGMVQTPAPPAPSAALTNAARAVLTYFATSQPARGSVPQVKTFQSLYNSNGPQMPLNPDGIYGPKTQAALQSVVGSAPVPAHILPVTVMAAPPAIPAAKPVAGFDVTGAATILANMAATQSGSRFPKTSDKRVSTFQAAYNTTPGVLHLAVDGKYGPGTQAALQSVLNWMGTGMQAPDNPFGAPPKSIPTYPGAAGAQAAATPGMLAALASQAISTGV